MILETISVKFNYDIDIFFAYKIYFSGFKILTENDILFLTVHLVKKIIVILLIDLYIQFK